MSASTRAAGAGMGVVAGLGLGLLALGPALRRGFLLSYDMVFVPRQPFTAALAGLTGGPPRAVPSDAVVAVVSRVLPADIVQKLILLAIFVLACSGAVALLAGEPWFARLAAGVCFAWNPFVAERLLIGQWALLLGYACLPWALRAVTTSSPASWRGAGRLALALLPAAVGGFAAMAVTALVVLPAAVLARLPSKSSATSPPGAAVTEGSPGAVPEGPPGAVPEGPPGAVSADPPGAVPEGPPGAVSADPPGAVSGGPPGVVSAGPPGVEPAGPPGAVSAGPPGAVPAGPSPVGPGGRPASVRRQPGPSSGPPAPQAGRRLAAGASALGVLILLSLPWLIPSLLRTVYADPAGVAAFAARADTPFGAFCSLLMLSGMWNAQTVPAGYGGWWSVLWLAFVVAAGAGYVAFGARRRRWPGLGFAAVAGLAVAVAGTTGPGQDLLRAMTGLWPGFAILRDGQQFVAPLALAEALGAGLLVAWAAKPRTRAARGGQPGGDRPAQAGGLVIAVVLLVAPVLLLPGLAWGAAGRLRPVWYPPRWLSAARLIDGSRAPGDALLLPWAAYRRPAWNGGRTMLDPWPRLLARTVIWNDGPQVGGVRLSPDDPAARLLAGAIQAPGPLTRAFAADGVRFVIVDSGGNMARRLPGCVIIATGPGLVVYRVPGGRGTGGG